MYYTSFRGNRISGLGMGTLRLPMDAENPHRIDRRKAQAVLDRALAGGINYIDTAYTYQDGDSERFLGEALAKYPRDSYYLATKFYAPEGSDIQDVFEQQLSRCRTEYFDFYLLHGMDENSVSAYMDEKNNYLGYLLEQKEAGRIRYLGFSSHAAPATLERFLDWYSGFDMALLQLNYLDWTMLEGRKQYEILVRHNIPVWVMEPLKGGILSTLNPKAVEILRAAAPDRSVSSWAFRFLMGLDHLQVVLSGMSDVEQVQDNVRTFAAPEPLNAAEQQALEKAVSVFIQDLGVPCSGCRYCCPTCPAKLDIPLLLKGYNEVRVSGETWRVADLPDAEHGPEACLQCGRCVKRCPQKIDIPQTLRMFASMRAGDPVNYD